MIKFAVKGDDNRTLFGFGLSAKNIEMIKNDCPIKFDGESIGLNGMDFLIFSGDTEESMKKDLEQYIGPRTKVKDGLKKS